MEDHAEELGFLYRISANNTVVVSNRTYFDVAVPKFGYQKVLEIMQEHMPTADEMCAVCGLYPFMIAASYEESSLSVVYFLLRQFPSLVINNCNSNNAVGSTSTNLKRKHTRTA